MRVFASAKGHAKCRRAATCVAARHFQKQGLPPPLKAGSVKQLKCSISGHGQQRGRKLRSSR